MLNLILSLDYELFGNGAGDVRETIIEPTNRILDICDKHDCRLTIMFEVAEYWSFKEAESANLLKSNYSPASEMEKQIVGAIIRGHDVQLHIHPQWIGAEHVDGIWRLRMNQYRLSDLPNGFGVKDDMFSITGALYKGRKTLEEIIKPFKPDYECRVFRAGGYCLQPAKGVIKAMKNVGLYADSSVVCGLKAKEPFKLDYSNAENNYGYWWCKEDDVSQKGEEGENIIEYPVCSEMKPYFINFAPKKLFTTLRRKRIEGKDRHLEINKVKSTPDVAEIIQNFFYKHPHKLDFCKLSALTMYKTVKNLSIKSFAQVIPIVMIGHSKDFWNDKELDLFINKIKKTENMRFSTFSEVTHTIRMAHPTMAFVVS